ncbi:TlpA family protein disulfide reductase [Ruminiclostridium papyrosolvens]|uniref:Alkyl hydroperoxide reductase n=1 Tax=Ruminiclostridium papyrosolvens C7 TaxID=1330534 RepID=U4QZ10_9FIRM|nr:TlpA disulfide reductase family protein [Ruminiclostridium papyrosolvens]EPR10194.1 alkyl hydroperoxide reductase [Ruminiclostridium papyrosolvens C7]
MNKKATIIIWIIAAFAIIAAAYTFYSKNKSQTFVTPPQDTALQSQAAQSTKIMAPDFTLKDIDGKTVKLSDYKGKIVILNFWAVWCKYCLIEIPDFNELDKQLAKENNAVILAVDVQESEATVKKYLTSNNIGLKVLMDTDGAVSETYGISGFPTTFLINKDGSVYTYISGKTDKETILKFLDKMG